MHVNVSIPVLSNAVYQMDNIEKWKKFDELFIIDQQIFNYKMFCW